MSKITRTYRLEPKIVEALELLSKGSMASQIETLVFREAMYKLDPTELQRLFGDDYERLMLMYAISSK